MRSSFRCLFLAVVFSPAGTNGIWANPTSAESTAAELSVVAAPVVASEPALTVAQMMKVYGWMAGMRAGLSNLNFSEEEMASFQEGLMAAAAGEEPGVDLQEAAPAIAQFMQAKFDAHMQALKAEQEAQAAAFWEALSADGGVQVLPSGLAYKIGQAGSGPKPTPVDTVRAHYTGRLIDGTVFDSSAGGEPFQTQLNRVIPGWTEGLGLIGAGGMITLYVPAKLGYGDEGSGDIPPGATLIFEVELVEVIPVELPAEPSEE